MAATGDGPQLAIAGMPLTALAESFGTPLYVFDAATLDAAAAAYRHALATHYPGAAGITYAGKAFLCKAIARWTQRHEIWLDCTGVGEIGIAVAAGTPRRSLLVHGVKRAPRNLAAAVAHAGVIVVDNLTELERLTGLLAGQTERPELWLRMRPGLAVDTHAYRQTGQSDSKFGLDGTEIAQGVAWCQAHNLPLTGLHFHQGSHFHDPAPIGPAVAMVLELAASLRAECGWTPAALSPGGGWGVPYHEDDLPHPAIEDYVKFTAEAIVRGCEERNLPLPRLQLEPGRSLLAQAGWRSIGSARSNTAQPGVGCFWTAGWPTIQDLRSTAHATQPCRCNDPLRPAMGPAWLAGPYCESGDILIEALPLPELVGRRIACRACEWRLPVGHAEQLQSGSRTGRDLAGTWSGHRDPAAGDNGGLLLTRRM